MQHRDAKKLLDKYQSGNCSPEEKALVEYWFHHLNADKDHNLSDAELETAHEDMWHLVKPPAKITPMRLIYRRMAVAAFILFVLSVSGYFLLKKPGLTYRVAKIENHDVAPGGNKAVLTLANGEQIVLTDAGKGNIATENNTAINKTAEGKLVYINNGTKSLVYNTISTPRGGQYSLTLSDGTRVFLNAASSLKYPVAFTGKERMVELTGEAYFEVAGDAAKPFKVTTGNQVVEVLGTHFNINSYSDEAMIRTTLVEGSVRVSVGKQTLLLKPGEQSQAIPGAGGELKILLKTDADISGDIAWRNDLFQFKNASIREVMKDAARWYDVDVIYEGDLPASKINGQMSRKVNLSGLLELMEFAGAKVKIEGRRVTISKQNGG